MSRKYVELKEVAGKAIENVTLFTAHDFHAIAIRFQDATILHIDLKTRLHRPSRLHRLANRPHADD